MGFFSKNKYQPEPELDALTEEAQALEEKMRQLESFVEKAPQLAKDHYDEQYATMPPPDELEDRRRERMFMARTMSRNEVRNERRYQAQSGFMIFLLLLSAAAMIAWAIKIANSGL